MNLRVFHYGTLDWSPSDGRPLEVVMHDFQYNDLSAGTIKPAVASTSTFAVFEPLIYICIVVLRENTDMEKTK